MIGPRDYSFLVEAPPPRSVALGLAVVGLLCVVAIATETAPIEADLSLRGARALGVKRLEQPGLAVTGRDVWLSGEAFTEASRRSAAESVGKVWGVRLVNTDATALILPASPYVWSATRDGAALTLAGDAPDPDARAAIVAVARGIKGAEVDDRMKYARGRTDGLVAASAFALSELALMSSGAAEIKDGALTLTGAAAGPGGYERAIEALANPPDGLALAKVNIAPPLAAPFVFSAASAGGTLKMTGEAPSLAARDAIEADAKRLFSNATIVVAISIAAGAPAGDFVGAVRFGLEQIAKLDDGRATLTDAKLTISGKAKSAGAIEALHDAAPALPSGFALAAANIAPSSSR